MNQKTKNCALEEQIDDLKDKKEMRCQNMLRDTTSRELISFEGERKKLLKLSNDCQSEYNVLKSH